MIRGEESAARAAWLALRAAAPILTWMGSAAAGDPAPPVALDVREMSFNYPVVARIVFSPTGEV